MASDWKKLSFAEAGVLLIDCVHKTPAAAATGFPYVAIPQVKEGRIDLSLDVRLISESDFNEWTKKANPQADDVILSRRCNPGETAYVPRDLQFALGQNLVLLRASGSKIYPPFLRWLVRGPEWWEQIQKFLNVGAVFDSLRCGDVPKFEFTIPPLAEQKKISEVLGTLDAKIELNRKINETLEQMARAIFRSWFIDFDPVRAKAEGRKPFGMDAATASLFPDSFEPSEHGEVPKGWRAGSLAELCDANAWTLTSKDQINPIHYIEISSVGAGVVNEVAIYERGQEPSRARRRLKHFDTVLSTVRPDRSAYFLAIQPADNLLASTGFAVLTTKTPSSALFVHYAVARTDFFEDLGRLADGGAYPAVSPQVILSRPLVIPSSDLCQAFQRVVEPLVLLKDQNDKESKTLAQTRDFLLPRLLSGEVTIKEAS